MRRRAQGAAPSSIGLEHGDLLVMDGLAQPEHVHRTVSGPVGSTGYRTFRWLTIHIASCPLAGAICCALPSCAQGLAEPRLEGGGTGVAKSALFWLMVLLSVHLGVLPLGAWRGLNNRGGVAAVARAQPTQRCAPLKDVPPAGLGEGVGDCCRSSDV